MAAEERGQSTALGQRLKEGFYRFSSFQAIALSESLAAGKKPLGEALRPAEEAVRLRVKPGFAFPPSDIVGYRYDDEQDQTLIDVSYLGLVGPAGILPHWYNELALERSRSRDFVLTDFFDLFHHRLLTLFYLAWKKAHIPQNYRTGGTDRFSLYFRSLIGLGTEKKRSLSGLGVESLLYFSGLLSRQVPSTAAIESALSHFSGQNAVVQQFVERAISLPPEDLTKIGKANAELGVSALCGSLVWENMSKFRIDLGPMDSASFGRFLPGGPLLQPMFALVRFMVGIEYEFEIRVILRRDQVAPCSLGGGGSAFSPMLGWSTWVKSPDASLGQNPGVTFQETDAVVLKAA